jgi:hypothetical protein
LWKPCYGLSGPCAHFSLHRIAIFGIKVEGKIGRKKQ